MKGLIVRLDPRKNPITVSAFVGSLITMGAIILGHDSLTEEQTEFIKSVLIGLLTILAGYAKDK